MSTEIPETTNKVQQLERELWNPIDNITGIERPWNTQATALKNEKNNQKTLANTLQQPGTHPQHPSIVVDQVPLTFLLNNV